MENEFWYFKFTSNQVKGLTSELIAIGFLLIASPVLAQTSPIPSGDKPNPNSDRFPQPQPPPQPLPPNEPPIIQTPPTTTPAPEAPSVKISVSKIEVTGSTILSSDEIAALTKPFIGTVVTLAELRKLEEQITQIYISRGYIYSRAVLANQTITDGVVKILVIEGSLEKIEVEGTRRLNPAYVRNRVALGTDKPLRADKIEDQLRLLKADPLFTNIEATLKPGSSIGKGILTVKVRESNAFTGFIGIDNYSSPAVGSERFGGVISYRNLTGNGDELSAYYYRSTAGGANSYDFNYRIPVNPMNGTLQLRYAPSNSRIISTELPQLGIITANSQVYEISYRQPLIRTPREEFALSLGFALQDGQTFLSGVPQPFGDGADSRGNSKTRVLKFGQDYIKRDFQGAWALRSQFNFGLDVLDATVNTENTPDGRFFSWLGQIQRVQRLGTDNLLIAQAEVQLTPDSLLPAQQFVIGGGQSLRGYRQNARSGDNGFRLSLENRIAIQRNEAGEPNLQLAPFIDIGAVWNKSSNPNQLIGETFLTSVGLGVIWEPIPRFLVRVDYAVPLIETSDRSNNAQDRGLNFNVGYSF